MHSSLTYLKKNISISKMHWLAEGLRKVQVEPGILMATQNFKRNLLILCREGEKNLTLRVCFLLPLKRERKNVWHLQPVSSIGGPLAFLPLTLSMRAEKCSSSYSCFMLCPFKRQIEAQSPRNKDECPRTSHKSTIRINSGLRRNFTETEALND